MSNMNTMTAFYEVTLMVVMAVWSYLTILLNLLYYTVTGAATGGFAASNIFTNVVSYVLITIDCIRQYIPDWMQPFLLSAIGMLAYQSYLAFCEMRSGVTLQREAAREKAFKLATMLRSKQMYIFYVVTTFWFQSYAYTTLVITFIWIVKYVCMATDPDMVKLTPHEGVRSVVMQYGVVEGRVMTYVIIDNQRIELLNAEGETLEAYTGARVTDISQHKYHLVITNPNMQFLGNAVYANTNSGRLILTSTHVVENEEYVLLSKGAGKAKRIFPNQWLFRGQLAIFAPGPEYGADLAISAIDVKQLNFGSMIKAEYTLDGCKYNTSVSRASQGTDCEPREYIHGASTQPGASGCGIYQDSKLVGIHVGSKAGNVNRFYSLLTFSINKPSVKHTKISKVIGLESLPQNGEIFHEDVEYLDWEDFSLWRNLKGKKFHDEELNEFFDEMYEAQSNGYFREMDAVMNDMESQGYSYNSSQTKSVRKQLWNKYHMEANNIKKPRLHLDVEEDVKNEPSRRPTLKTMDQPLNKSNGNPSQKATQFTTTFTKLKGKLDSSANANPSQSVKLSQMLNLKPKIPNSKSSTNSSTASTKPTVSKKSSSNTTTDSDRKD